MKKFKSLALLTVSCLSLAACAENENPFSDIQMPDWQMPDWLRPAGDGKAGGINRELISAATAECPRVAAVQELANVTQFADETNPVANTVLSTTQMVKIDSSCITTENAFNLDISVNFVSRLGTMGLSQAAPQNTYQHPYFLAVVNPAGQIIAKDVFNLNPVFQSGQREVYSTERLQQSIPLSTRIPANQYQVMIGFQLSEAELSYNRAQHPATVKPLVAAPARAAPVKPVPVAKLQPRPNERPPADLNQ